MKTLGHGTLTQAAFASTARAAGIEVVVDVRRYPGSRRVPHFASEAMEAWLADLDLGYRWLPALGGRRAPRSDSRNLALRNVQFRAYADYMASPEFAAGIADLLALTAHRAGALMCAESVWWRCHRRLVADHLVLVEGIEVHHVFHDGRVVAHPVTEGARVGDGHVVYDGRPKVNSWCAT